MACDSCWASNGMQTTSLTKIDRLSSGALFGASGDGDVRAVLALIDKVKSPDKLPTKAELAATRCELTGIIVFKTGQVWMIAIERQGEHFDAMVWPANRSIAGVGSGGELAIGAMAAGKNAIEAVRIACRYDINSRAPVHTVKLAQ
jgi:hypothetical protein